MKHNAQIFIEDRELEFTSKPDILYNYKETDISNPTAVKNSFSKSIVVKGTPTNNDIFGNIWRLDRIQTYGEGTYSGALFNASRKASFTIYINGEIYEKGYCRLDSIKKNGKNDIEYSISLFGGLGSFFWGLTYMDMDNENSKMTLDSLIWKDGDGQEPDLNFRINKQTVWDAWNTIMGNPDTASYNYDEKWNVINFSPACYNGIPNDFDAGKFLINTNERENDTIKTSKTDGGYTYTAYNGYALGEMEQDLTCDETFDMRSYLQRPVLSFSKFIKACCQPENNGGYQVELDPHFFNDDNPYYSDAWMTLKMLKDMELSNGQSEVVTDGQLVVHSRLGYETLYDIVYPTPTMSSINNLDIRIRPKVHISGSEKPQNLYMARNAEFRRTAPFNLSTTAKKYMSYQYLMVQLVAYNDNNAVIGVSDAYVLCSEKYDRKKKMRLFDDSISVPNYRYLVGRWDKDSDGSYSWTDMDGYGVDLSFSLSTDEDYSYVRLRVAAPSYSQVTTGTHTEWRSLQNESELNLFSVKDAVVNGNYSLTDAANLDRRNGSYGLSIESFSVRSTDYEAMFSDTFVDRSKLLCTENSPCDYLLSYAKLFGLYFFIDPNEIADDPSRCPNGVVHIMDRDTFYNTNEVVDLEGMIDRSKDISITPQMASSKWYEFSLEQAESEANSDYKNTYGKDYGTQTINTGYNFNSSTSSLYDGSVFKGGIMVRERDKYFSRPNGDEDPSYFFNGMTYHLFRQTSDGIDSDDITLAVRKTANYPIGTDDMEYFDAFPKLQLHSSKNDPCDGDGILLFYTGAKGFNTETEMAYWITDDTEEMQSLNDGTACWIATVSEYGTDGNRIAYKAQNVPVFSRHIINEDSGRILLSWDFGTPMVSYIPDTYNGSNMSLYRRFWNRYIADMYSDDTRKINCYCRIEDKVNPKWLRRFYWFDNCIWRLNTIKDWNMTAFGTTSMEFIKVNDLNAYRLDRIDIRPTVTLTLDRYSIGAYETVVNASVRISDGGSWYLEWEPEYVTPSVTEGIGDMDFTIAVSSNGNPDSRTLRITATDGNYSFSNADIVQEGGAEITITAAPNIVYFDYDAGSTGQFTVSSNSIYQITTEDL